jgi:uncharacterized glyoxalase superfamily protein PhnB
MPAHKRKARKQPAAPTFNHAMVYSRNVGAALPFYRDVLGLKVIEQMEHAGRCVYARLGSPGGTLALHTLEPGKTMPPEDVIRLYFEIKNLDKFCDRLQEAGVKFSQLPQTMPWGWKHAYLDDPDGHEVSLYWAGAKRFKKSAMSR